MGVSVSATVGYAYHNGNRHEVRIGRQDDGGVRAVLILADRTVTTPARYEQASALNLIRDMRRELGDEWVLYT